jgi:hypothetical protein
MGLKEDFLLVAAQTRSYLMMVALKAKSLDSERALAEFGKRSPDSEIGRLSKGSLTGRPRLKLADQP